MTTLWLIYMSLVSLAWGEEVGGAAELVASSSAVHSGELVELSWKTNGDNAYLTGVGPVPPKGHVTVTATQSAVYLLIAQMSGKIQVSSVSVSVAESDRDAPPARPDIEQFRYEVTGKMPAGTAVGFFDRMYRVLQDEFKVALFMPEITRDGRIVFMTRTSVRNDLRTEDDRHISRRRVSYLIEISTNSTTDGALAFAIRSRIEYLRAGESTWRVQGIESGENLYRMVSGDLKARLERAR